VESIYDKRLGLQGVKTLTLNADERMMIAEALSRCADNETDMLPAALLIDKVIDDIGTVKTEDLKELVFQAALTNIVEALDSEQAEEWDEADRHWRI